jgi:hypothetical protein
MNNNGNKIDFNEYEGGDDDDDNYLNTIWIR